MFFFTSLFGNEAKQSYTLQSLIETMLENNVEIKAAEENVKAAQMAIGPANSLPDPVLGFNMLNLPVDTYAFDQEPMTGKQISLMQKFPFPGKLGLQKQIANKTVEIQKMQVEELKNQTIKKAKLIYYQVYFLEKAIEVSTQNTVVLRQLNKIAQTKYEVGKGIQQDVLRLSLELAKLEEKLIQLKQEKKAQQAQLKFLLNQPVEEIELTFEELEPPQDSLNLEKLNQIALEKRPALQAAEIQAKQSGDKTTLTRKNYLPDLSLGVAYTQREVLNTGMGGVDFLSGSVSLNLPLYFWQKQKPQVLEAQSKTIALENQAKNVKNMILQEIEIRFSEFQKNQKLLTLYQSGIMTKAEQAVQSALASYQVEKVDFLTVLMNQMTLFNYELDYFRILCDAWKNLSELEALTGDPIN